MNPLHLFEKIVTARDEQALRAGLHDVTLQLGFDIYCYALVHEATDGSGPCYYTLHNYPDGWMEHYMAANYAAVDVTVTHCLARSTPLVWTRKLFDMPTLHALQEESLAWGIDGGVSFPIHSNWLSGAGMLLLASSEHADRSAARAADYLGAGQLLACHVSQAVRDLGFIAPELGRNAFDALSPRESECLHWAALGLPAKLIADRMGISLATVNTHYLPAIRRKLGTSSTREAVSVAIRHRLIRP